MNISDYAIQMESDGEMFYREQALENKDNTLHVVFISLAKDEERHAKIIKDKEVNIDFPLQENIASIKNVFNNTTEFDFEKSSPKQIDVYRKALIMEQASIDLYKKLLSESKGDEEFFKFLIKQEEEHYKLLKEIIKMVNRPSIWVEDAEFGIREEY